MILLYKIFLLGLAFIFITIKYIIKINVFNIFFFLIFEKVWLGQCFLNIKFFF